MRVVFKILITLFYLSLGAFALATDTNPFPEDYQLLTDQQCDNSLCNGRYVDPFQKLDLKIGEEYINISADIIENAETQVLLYGSVLFAVLNYQIRADNAVLNLQDYSFNMEGNIKLRSKGLLITADSVISSSSKTLVFNNAKVLTHEAHSIATGDVITLKPYKGKRGHIHIRNATYTTCEPGSNEWKLHSASMVLNLNINYAFMNHPRIEMYGVPVAYIPWGFLSMYTGRQWGVLAPVISSSEHSGTDIIYPLYMPFNGSSDITFSPRNSQNRGDGFELQFRLLTRNSYTEYDASYLRRDESFIKFQNDLGKDEYGERWLSRVVHKMHYPIKKDWALKADIDYFSLSDSHFVNDNAPTTFDTSILDGIGHVAKKAKIWLETPVGFLTYGIQNFESINGYISQFEHYAPYWSFESIKQYNNQFTSLVNIHSASVYDSQQRQRQRDWADLGVQYQRFVGLVDLAVTAGVQYLKIADYQSVDAPFLTVQLESYLSNSSDVATTFSMYWADYGGPNQEHLPVSKSVAVLLDYHLLFEDSASIDLDRVADYQKVALGVEWLGTKGDSNLNWRVAIGGQKYTKASQVLQQKSISGIQQRDWQLYVDSYFPLTEQSQLVNKYNYNTQTNRSEINSSYLFYNNKVKSRQQIVEVSFHDYWESKRQQQLNFAMYSKILRKVGFFANYQQSLIENRNISTIFGFRYESCCLQIDILKYDWEQIVVNDGVNNSRDSGILLQFNLKGAVAFGKGINYYAQRLFSTSNIDVDSDFSKD